LNLVTGATGLVGSHLLLTLLQEGKPVVALKRPNSNIKEVKTVFSFYTTDHEELFNKVIWREADLQDVIGMDELLNDVTTVYHCAALISLNDKDKELMLRINKNGTANLVNACLNKGVKEFCFVSSIATLQNKDITRNIDETVFWKTTPDQNAYALSKYLAEQEVWRGIEEGLNAVIVNPGVIVGPGNWGRGTGQLISLSEKGIRFYTEGETGFVAAKDVAGVMSALMNKKVFGERFVLIENNYSYKYILVKIHRHLGKPAPGIKAGRILLEMARTFGFLIPGDYKLSSSTISNLLGKTSYSGQKLGTFLDYKYTSIDETIDFTSQCFQKTKTQS
jgi:dihydroflavonol-4-reductase